MFSYHANNVAMLDPLRNFLRQATEDFLSRGGEVRHFAPDVWGEETRPAHRLLRNKAHQAHQRVMGGGHG